MLVKRAQFFQNDDYVKAQAQANMHAERQWQKILEENDLGVIQDWTAANYDDSQWQTINQWHWNWRGAGTVWLRQHIKIDKEHAGKPARLMLGTLFDRDVTYLNGQMVGQTGYQYPPRRYDIPEGLLKEGDNVISIRFINKFGAVHFIPEKPYMLCFGDDRFSQNPMPADVLPLAETWKMCVGAEMPNCPSGDISLYADYLKKLMGCWRDRWQDSQMPFVIVQLANYDGRQQTGFPRPITPQTEPTNSGWAQLREAQRIAAKNDPRAELAVINDLGETVDIHPLRKKEVAERIGLAFDRLIYNNKVELAGDKVFKNVDAAAEGNRITLTLPESFHPMSVAYGVRYAWKDNPLKANVRSLSGLPMSSFEMKINK